MNVQNNVNFTGLYTKGTFYINQANLKKCLIL